jgi:thioredoxin 1
MNNKIVKGRFFLIILIFTMFFIGCKSENKGATGSNTKGDAVVALNTESFKKLIFNYDLNKEWKYESDKPAIIDFYADWCAPCRQLSPIVQEIAKEYAGKIVVYKVDTEKEKALAQSLGLTGLPTLLFIPAKGQPKVSMGLLPKDSLVKRVNEILLVK